MIRVRPALNVQQALGMGALVALAAFIAVEPRDAITFYKRQAQVAEREDARWTVSGPPCVPLSQAAFERQPFHPEVHGFDFQALKVVYAFGDAECRNYGDWRSSYTRCMFTSPGVIHVATGGAEAFYTPGVGQPATITLEDGKLSCVLSSHFTAVNPAFGQDPATWDRTHPVNHGDGAIWPIGRAG